MLLAGLGQTSTTSATFVALMICLGQHFRCSKTHKMQQLPICALQNGNMRQCFARTWKRGGILGFFSGNSAGLCWQLASCTELQPGHVLCNAAGPLGCHAGPFNMPELAAGSAQLGNCYGDASPVDHQVVGLCAAEAACAPQL